MYVQEHILVLNLDIDQVRGLIGQWRDQALEAGLLARKLALAMAEAHLASGHDVIIPQYLGRPQFIEELEQLAATLAIPFHEIVLLDSKRHSLRRFYRRAEASDDPVHVEAQQMVDLAGGPPELEAMYERLVDLLDARPRARILRTQSGEVDRAYHDFVSQLT
jgi:predicted kinase